MNILESYKYWLSYWKDQASDEVWSAGEMLFDFIRNLVAFVMQVVFIVIPFILLILLFPITAPLSAIFLYLRDRRLSVDRADKTHPANYGRAINIIEKRMKVFPKSKYYSALLKRFKELNEGE